MRWLVRCAALVALPGGLLAQAGEGAANRAIPAAATPSGITPSQRLEWFATASVGPASLTGGVISAGFGTWINSPKEYGTHWGGFAERYGMRLTGVVTSNAMEAGLGALWGEDPRYERAAGRPFGARVRHIVAMTFEARNAHGGVRPACARFIAIAGNNFLSNSWREPSEATNERATVRVGLGFLGRMASNAFNEFWPDVSSRLRSRHSTSDR